MAEDMIERVARAMASADDEDYMECAREYDRRARAAIEAMLEPSDAVVEAGRGKINFDDHATVELERTDTLSAWQAMIQAALSGDPR